MGKWNTATSRFESVLTASDLEDDRYNLYNGNIGSMVNTLTDPANHAAIPLGNAYTYDQLHRINRSRTYDNLSASTNTWGAGTTYAGKYENTFTYDASGNIERQLRKDEAGNEIDSLTYKYESENSPRKRNRLYHVNDSVPDIDYPDDIDNMGSFQSAAELLNVNNNYRYDELGQLVYDAQEEIGEIDWRNDGKIRSIVRLGSSPSPDLAFTYDPSGNRLSKKVYDATGELLYTNYYLRDAQGNVMATYKHRIDAENETSIITVDELNIYGSDRLGLYTYTDTVYPLPPALTAPFQPVWTGLRKYELKNHLGNVTTVINSHKIPQDANSDLTIDGYKAQIEAGYDYSPFGVTRLSFEPSAGGTVEGNPIAPDFRWCLDANTIEANGSGLNGVRYAMQNQTDRFLATLMALRSTGVTTSYLDIPDNAAFDFGAADFTVGIWVRKEASVSGNNHSMAVGKWNSNASMATNEWCLNISSTTGTQKPPQFRVVVGSTAYTAEGTNTLANGQWYHLVGVREGGTIKLYLNGALVGTQAIGSGAINNIAGREIKMGKTDGNNVTTARYDEFVIYHRALTATEVSALHQATCPDLVSEPIELAEGEGYRYGFNGMEKDDEVKGSGNSYDFGARMFDPRLGRWFAMDPLAAKYASQSPYNFGLNNPIYYVDPDGEDPREGGKEISINFVTFRVINSKDTRSFGGRKRDITLFAKSLDEWARTEAKVTAITQGSEWLKQAWLYLDPELRDEYQTSENFMDAAHMDSYILREIQYDGENLSNLNLSRPSSVIERQVENLGVGFEAEVTRKDTYAVGYDSDGNANPRIHSSTSFTLIDNPWKGAISDERLNAAGQPTTEKVWAIQTTFFDSQGNAQGTTAPEYKAATPRPENSEK